MQFLFMKEKKQSTLIFVHQEKQTNCSLITGCTRCDNWQLIFYITVEESRLYFLKDWFVSATMKGFWAQTACLRSFHAVRIRFKSELS